MAVWLISYSAAWHLAVWCIFQGFSLRCIFESKYIYCPYFVWLILLHGLAQLVNSVVHPWISLPPLLVAFSALASIMHTTADVMILDHMHIFAHMARETSQLQPQSSYKYKLFAILLTQCREWSAFKHLAIVTCNTAWHQHHRIQLAYLLNLYKTSLPILKNSKS